MYVQIRKAGKYEYIYVVEAYRKSNGKIAHRGSGRFCSRAALRDPPRCANMKIRSVHADKY